MIAIDTNILVYAHRPEMPEHDNAKKCLSRLVQSGERVGFPLHCLLEFSGVVSNQKIWKTASSPKDIEKQIQAWLAPPNVQVLTEESGFLKEYLSLLDSSGAKGGAVHDARIAASAIFHGAKVLWSADRDFGRYPALRTRNPLVS